MDGAGEADGGVVEGPCTECGAMGLLIGVYKTAESRQWDAYICENCYAAAYTDGDSEASAFWLSEEEVFPASPSGRSAVLDHQEAEERVHVRPKLVDRFARGEGAEAEFGNRSDG